MADTRGYLTICQNGKDDYVRMAYALGLSLRSQKSDTQFAIIVSPGTEIPVPYRNVFDHVIELKEDWAEDATWKVHNKWQIGDLSPFDHTVLLDADMLFSEDVSWWWPIMERRSMMACSSVLDHRGQVVTSDHYRRVFTHNGLPNIYSAFMYFKKDRRSEEVFGLTRDIINKWPVFVKDHLWRFPPKMLSGDVAFALAIRLIDGGEDFVSELPVPTFVHMKSQIQGWATEVTEDWQRHILSEVRPDGSIYVGNYRQRAPFHYHRKDFLTDEIVSILEQAYAG